MTQSLNWTRDGDKLSLVGELDQDVLNPLWDARIEAMTGVTCIDLSQVSRVDTGGLALLVHLISLVKEQGNNVSLSGVNDKVFTLAELYNLPADVLPRQ
ncbi:lipid asymmetry maintenance protein MlaB [Citrobacter amalonaticus]|uniref:lipid asymmetry maintenance protein MlaB n=1 Tax=Citrobacter amalonaticus TaxID=35703 RepID=UPI00076B798D|nr:lipid asymmetry maintenance protein MlaB [Citrobacter amalonaticus]AMG93001.1 STAS domain-containing protein [Citrobacter amalonaticus]HED1254491.1 lipid asymmetry maintenance protein MlaB [Citrobacter amalonaticus]